MFACITTITRYHRDECNRWIRTRSERALRADTEGALYESMAALRAKHASKPDPDADDDDGWEDERHEVSFGQILRIAEASSADEARIEATGAWRAHRAEIARLMALRADRLSAEALLEAEAEEARARALYRELGARFGEAGADVDTNEGKENDR